MATAEFITGLAGGFASGREMRRREQQDQLDRATRQGQTDFENALALRRMEEDRRREFKREGFREQDIERETGIREQDLARRAQERTQDEERGRLSQQAMFENQRQLQEERILAAFGAREQQAQERAMAEAQAQEAGRQEEAEAQAKDQDEVIRRLAIRNMPASRERAAATGEVGFSEQELLARTIQDLARQYGLDPSRLLSPQEIARTTLLQQQEEATAQALMARQQAQEDAQLQRAAIQIGTTNARLKASAGQPVDVQAEIQAALQSLTLSTPRGQAAGFPGYGIAGYEQSSTSPSRNSGDKMALVDQAVEELVWQIPVKGATDEDLLSLVDENLGPDDVAALEGFGFREDDLPILRRTMFLALRAKTDQPPPVGIPQINPGTLFSGSRLP